MLNAEFLLNFDDIFSYFFIFFRNLPKRSLGRGGQLQPIWHRRRLQPTSYSRQVTADKLQPTLEQARLDRGLPREMAGAPKHVPADHSPPYLPNG